MMSLYQRLWKVGLTVLKHRRMSAQEAAYRISALHLLQSSRSVVYVNTRPQQNRFKMLKPMHEIMHMNDNNTDIFCSGIVDYYYSRPDHLEDICLYFFTSWYERCSIPTGNMIRSRQERIYVTKFDVFMKKRNRAAVVKYPKFSVGSEEYYYSLLMLLLPHRCEDELLVLYDSARDALTSKKNHFQQIQFTHISFAEEIENSIRRIRLARYGSDFEHTGQCMNTHLTDHDISTNEDNASLILNHGTSTLAGPYHDGDTLSHHLEACLMSPDEYSKAYDTLTKSQQIIIQFVQKHYARTNHMPLRLFITGGAGVGKTFLTRLIIAYLQLQTSTLHGVNPVRICAPTGTAARNIQGQTIHSLLAIPVQQYITYEQQILSWPGPDCPRRLPVVWKQQILSWPGPECLHRLLVVWKRSILSWPGPECPHRLPVVWKQQILSWPAPECQHRLPVVWKRSILSWPGPECQHRLLVVWKQQILCWPGPECPHCLPVVWKQQILSWPGPECQHRLLVVWKRSILLRSPTLKRRHHLSA